MLKCEWERERLTKGSPDRPVFELAVPHSHVETHALGLTVHDHTEGVLEGALEDLARG